MGDLHHHIDLQLVYIPSSNYSSSRIFQTTIQMQSKSPYSKIHLTATAELPSNLHLEICNVMLKGKYYKKNLLEFWKCLLSNEYAQLKSYAHKLMSVFGSMYLSEKAFSKMKYYNLITDQHWQMNICIQF